MKLCLTADNLENITWWVDASYVVHWDSRSHTGMAMHLLELYPTDTSGQSHYLDLQSRETDIVRLTLPIVEESQ